MRFAPLVLFLVAARGGLLAQSCSPGDLLLKHDSLPAVPTGISSVAVVPGLCEGEAAMAVFDTPGAVTVRKVSILFGNAPLGTNGNVAAVDIEIYDGATLGSNGVYSMGPMVWSLSGSTNSNLQITTHGLNEFAIPGTVRATSGKLVVGWRMLINAGGGSCAFGYPNNFCTDNSPNCIPGRNVIDALPPIGAKVDPASYNFSAIGWPGPLCGSPFYRGDWIIRACVTPDVSTTWTGSATPGGAVLLNLSAPGHPNEYYLTLLSMGTSPGWTTPFGSIPLNPDFLMTCSLTPSCGGQLLVNGTGQLNANSTATAVLLIPNLPFLYNSNLTVFAGFVASQSPGIVPFSAVSSPSPPIVIR
ncbi:MAG: hypothetical protein Fur0037_24050 [Planctomycetota bacterium]